MIAGKRICSACKSTILIPDGVTTNLTCQSCGSVKGKIVSDFPLKYLRFTCRTCGEQFLYPADLEGPLVHPICGGIIFTIDTTADSFAKSEGKEGEIIEKKKEVNETVSIIILTWNNLKYTKKCVSSIKQNTKLNYQLIFVDNGSDDETVDYLSGVISKDDVLICNGRNRGFSEGNNQGMKHATGDYILLLNNDTFVEQEGWLEKLISAEKVYGGLVGPTLRKVIRDDQKGMFLYVGNGEYKDDWCYLEAWCLLGKRSLFEELEGFDQRFFCYSEDADMSFRVKKNMLLPLTQIDIPVVHYGQKTSSMLEREASGQSEISNRLLYKKWISNDTKRILVVREGAIGDVLYSTPIVKALKKKFPTARLTYKTKAPALLIGNPYVDEVIEYIDNDVFDKKYYLEYESDGQRNLIDVMAEQADVKLKSRKLVLTVSRKEYYRKLCPSAYGNYVVVHTGKTWKSRQWSIENFNVVASYLMKKKFKIVLIGDRDTPALFGSEKIIGYYDQRGSNWENTIGIIDNCAFFLGLDSAPSVIAKALGKPSFIIYGCVDPKTRYADAVEFPLYDKTLECAGCRGRTSDHDIICPKETIECLELITPTKAIQKIGRYLKSLKKEKEENRERTLSKRSSK